MLGEDERLREAALLIREMNLGATAIGTGINAHPDYAAIVCRKLVEISGIPVLTAPNLIEATQDCGSFVQLSGVSSAWPSSCPKSATTCACSPPDHVPASAKSICRRARLARPSCRARSTGDPEVVNQIAFEVIGNDTTVTFAAEAGQLQLNAFEPIIAHSLFKSVLHLSNGCKTLADYCVDGITANRDALRASVERSIGIVTALNPYIGYANATEIAAEAHLSGRGVAEIVLERD
jgi:aspartate ammonia-lyase